MPVSPQAARGGKGSRGSPEGRRPKRATALSRAPGPESPGRAPCPRLSQTLAPPRLRPQLPARPRLLPCRGCAVSSDAAQLRIAQRPTDLRTAGEARDRRSHPRRPCCRTSSYQHLVRCLRERWTPQPPLPLPQQAHARTPPSKAQAPRARSTAPRCPCAGAHRARPRLRTRAAA